MRQSEASMIARRAAQLAVTDCNHVTFEECYEEYMDQLVNNDDQCLRTWLRWKAEEEGREAAEILKRLDRSRIAETPGAATPRESK